MKFAPVEKEVVVDTHSSEKRKHFVLSADHYHLKLSKVPFDLSNENILKTFEVDHDLVEEYRLEVNSLIVRNKWTWQAWKYLCICPFGMIHTVLHYLCCALCIEIDDMMNHGEPTATEKIFKNVEIYDYVSIDKYPDGVHFTENGLIVYRYDDNNHLHTAEPLSWDNIMSSNIELLISKKHLPHDEDEYSNAANFNGSGRDRGRTNWYYNSEATSSFGQNTVSLSDPHYKLNLTQGMLFGFLVPYCYYESERSHVENYWEVKIFSKTIHTISSSSESSPDFQKHDREIHLKGIKCEGGPERFEAFLRENIKKFSKDQEAPASIPLLPGEIPVKKDKDGNIIHIRDYDTSWSHVLMFIFALGAIISLTLFTKKPRYAIRLSECDAALYTGSAVWPQATEDFYSADYPNFVAQASSWYANEEYCVGWQMSQHSELCPMALATVKIISTKGESFTQIGDIWNYAEFIRENPYNLASSVCSNDEGDKRYTVSSSSTKQLRDEDESLYKINIIYPDSGCIQTARVFTNIDGFNAVAGVVPETGETAFADSWKQYTEGVDTTDILMIICWCVFPITCSFMFFSGGQEGSNHAKLISYVGLFTCAIYCGAVVQCFYMLEFNDMLFFDSNDWQPMFPGCNVTVDVLKSAKNTMIEVSAFAAFIIPAQLVCIYDKYYMGNLCGQKIKEIEDDGELPPSPGMEKEGEEEKIKQEGILPFEP
jgi:hypothetical protein